MNSRTTTLPKKLTCMECGHVQIIHRPKGRNRPTGHIKHMYCPRCKATMAHTEAEVR